MPNIVVLGAGVSGLTVALALSKNKDNVVTIAAKHMPGDYDIEYTSPWAGADFTPFSDIANSRWERESWPEIARLASDVPEAGIHFVRAQRLKGSKAGTPKHAAADVYADKPWFSDLLPDFKVIPESELPEGFTFGQQWTSACINTALYLPWLLGQCRKQGVVLKRANLSHISEAAGWSHTGRKADVVVNCAGLLACKLGGVQDESVKPARGQIILVRNEFSHSISLTGTGDTSGDLTYTMTRASGGGTVLGGTYQLGNWDGTPDMDIGQGILERVAKWHPDMKGKTVEDLDVVRHGVGLRPYREGGVRIEREKIREVEVVHNYGHGGWGYQGSYGCAERVVELVNEVLAGKQGEPADSKL